MLRKLTLQTLPIIATFFLSSCSTQHLTGNPVGPLIGATATGGAAALFGANRYFIGLSALTGGALGYYFTTQHFTSRNILAKGGNVFIQGEYVTIDLPTDAFFEENSDILLSDTLPALYNTANILKRFPNDSIIVSGNTSGYDIPPRELKLSRKRAKVIAEFLEQQGLTSTSTDQQPVRRFTYVGNGYYFPIANEIKAKSIRENSHIQISGYPNFSHQKIHVENIGRDPESLPGALRRPDMTRYFPNTSYKNLPVVIYGSSPWKSTVAK